MKSTMMQTTISSVRRYGLLILLTLNSTATVLCLHYSRTHRPAGSTPSSSKDGSGVYIVSTLVLSVELLKFIANIVLLFAQMGCSFKVTGKLIYDQILIRPFDTSQLAIPGLLYIVQDNLTIFALTCLDAATFQVAYLTRILITAIFAKFMLKEQLTMPHWVALVLLMVGVVLAQGLGSASFVPENNGGESTYLYGIAAVLSAAIISSFAGVYNEKVLKNGQQPLLFIRSIQLSFFASLFSALTVIVKDGDKVASLGFFHGYDNFVFFIAFIQACGGIIVAATLKYADNILKTFSNAISVVISCLLSYLLLGDLNLAPTFLVGATIIILASLLYGRASAGNRILQFSVSNLKLPMKNKSTILPLLSMVDSNKSMQDKA